MDQLTHLAQTFLTTGQDILPIVGIIIGFQALVIRRPIAQPKKILSGFFYVILGIALFLEGLDLALFPLGKLMATQLAAPEFLSAMSDTPNTTWQTYYWVYIFAACLGFATTFAEPSLLAVALKAEEISGGAIQSMGLRFAVSVGVASGLALGTFRIVTGTELYYYLLCAYLILIVQTLFAPKAIIGLAYDSGGVTTSTVTVPLVTSMGLGLAQTIPGRNPMIDGFGLIAFACLFPIITVLGYAQIAHWWSNREQNDD
jgi:Protein of unknown function (DUF1538)